MIFYWFFTPKISKKIQVRSDWLVFVQSFLGQKCRAKREFILKKKYQDDWSSIGGVVVIYKKRNSETQNLFIGAFRKAKCQNGEVKFDISPSEMLIHSVSVFAPEHDGDIFFFDKKLFMPQNREHIFNHLIIFFELFHKDIRKWGAILIRNVSTFRRVKCHFPTPQNGISPTEMPYRLLIDFGFLGFVYSNHRISVSFGS
jgi:hypothetical protein